MQPRRGDTPLPSPPHLPTCVGGGRRSPPGAAAPYTRPFPEERLTIATEVVAVERLDAAEKRIASRDARLVAITHGDPTRASSCGRPVIYRPVRVTERRSADLVAVCSLHGDLVEGDKNTGGYTGAFAFFAADARTRRKSE
jgi:hypothetical protein